MKGLSLALLSLLGLVGVTADAWSQAALVAGPGGGAVVELEAIDAGPKAGSTPLLAGSGTLPAIFPSGLRVDLGFQYLRPVFPSRSVTLVVPTGVNSNLSSLGGSGNVSYDFGFIPTMSADYQFNDLGFGVSASAKLASLSGHLTRTIDSAAGSANLTANSTVNLAVANLLEGSKYIPLDRFPCFTDSCFQDTVLLATVGGQYSHVVQDYTASLSSGANTTTLTAHQNFDGFGPTMSLSFLHPLPSDLFLYGVSRGSFLLGTNNRNSNYSVVVSGNATTSTSAKLTENKTELIPVGEFEVGLAWGRPLAQRRMETLTPSQMGPLLWVKAGLVSQIWGNLGLLSAQDNVRGFSDSRMFLYGFSLMAGVEY